MRAKPTSFDIAHMAGVSQSTVSRALRNSPLVNKETRDKIQAIAQELNYKVDKNASNLRQQQSRTIALLLFEDPTTDDSKINPFFLSMLGSITRACAAEGYDLLVSFQQLSDNWHADYEDTNKADGLILLGYGDYVDYQDKLHQLQDQNTHFVLWGAVDPNRPGISISCDNFRGGYKVTQHLIRQGRKCFGFIGTADHHYPEFFERFKGHSVALEQAGYQHQPLKLDAISSEEAGKAALNQLLEQQPHIDAVVCASDTIALGVMEALKERGYAVPEDVAVVGYDNILLSNYVSPKLTTVQQDTTAAGEMLVKTVVKMIREEPVEDVILPAEVIVRESCGNTG
ncbi:LacI family DNA-binding transcriptional regulator [Saliniradius amylolyticus]|nr:LacI family DNA-binding transcriptional regulator [Saliniradius amylolyticus]